MTTKMLGRLLLFTFFLDFRSRAAELPVVGKLYVGMTYEYTYLEPHILGDQWPAETSDEWRFTGSFWSLTVASSGTPIFVTAAHVLGMNWNPVSVDGFSFDGEKAFLLSRHARVFLGPLGYKPSAIGYFTGLNDVAFLKPKDPRVFSQYKTIRLSSDSPHVGENVTIYGFPRHVVFQQKTDASV